MKKVRIAAMVLLIPILGLGCGPSLDLREAEKLMTKGRWSEAEDLLDGVARSHPKSEWGQKALMLKGCSFFKRSRLDEAHETLLEARDLAPKGKWADDCQYYLARVAYKRGEYSEAASGFRKVLTAFGDHPDLSNWKIRAMEELEHLEKMAGS